jgi:hypothetical protein
MLALVAVLSAGCADSGVKQMVTRPKPIASDGANSAERRVVLFRAVVDIEGSAMEEPWSLHFSGLGLFSVVGPKGANLTSAHSFLPGRPNAASSDEGWAFVALPPGTYQLLFEGTAIQFALPGAQYFASEAVPIGRSHLHRDVQLHMSRTFEPTGRAQGRVHEIRDTRRGTACASDCSDLVQQLWPAAGGSGAGATGEVDPLVP